MHYVTQNATLFTLETTTVTAQTDTYQYLFLIFSSLLLYFILLFLLSLYIVVNFLSQYFPTLLFSPTDPLLLHIPSLLWLLFTPSFFICSLLSYLAFLPLSISSFLFVALFPPSPYVPILCLLSFHIIPFLPFPLFPPSFTPTCPLSLPRTSTPDLPSQSSSL